MHLNGSNGINQGFTCLKAGLEALIIASTPVAVAMTGKYHASARFRSC